MSDINDATRYLDEDGLLTLADRIEDVYAKKTDVSKSIQATYEQSPTLAAHVADEYLYIKTGSSTHITYKTITSIAANTELVVGTNVKVFDDTGIPVYIDKVPGAGGGGVQPILRTEYVGTSTRSDQTIGEGRIIYYINKFYKVVKNGGLPASYTVVPATDLERVSLGTDIPVSVERMPAGAVITAADVSYDDGTVDDALTELNSNLVVETGTTNISGITYTKMGRLVTIHVINATAVDAVTVITGLPKPYGSAYTTSNICNTPIGVNGEVIGRIEYSTYGSTNNWHYYCHAAAGYTSLSYISS